MFQIGAINLTDQSSGNEVYSELFYGEINDIQKYLKIGIQFKYQKNVCVMVFDDVY